MTRVGDGVAVDRKADDAKLAPALVDNTLVPTVEDRAVLDICLGVVGRNALDGDYSYLSLQAGLLPLRRYIHI